MLKKDSLTSPFTQMDMKNAEGKKEPVLEGNSSLTSPPKLQSLQYRFQRLTRCRPGDL